MKTAVRVYSSGVEKRVERAVRGLCRSRQTARGLKGKRIPLQGATVDQLVQRMIYAASHAASGPIGNRATGRGAPPDNSRIILAHDVVQGCKDVGISPGLRFAPPTSFVVDLFTAIAPLIWPSSRRNTLSPRKTFERMKRAMITRN
jgi:hypothetical protein